MVALFVCWVVGRSGSSFVSSCVVCLSKVDCDVESMVLQMNYQSCMWWWRNCGGGCVVVGVMNE